MNKTTRDSRKSKEMIEIAKIRLTSYFDDLKSIDELGKRIDAYKERIYDLGSGWSSTTPVQGGSSSQEDKIIHLEDKIRGLEKEKAAIIADNRKIKEAINNLDSLSRQIVVHKWILRDMSMEKIKEGNDVSMRSMWRRSNNALIYIYRVLYEN